MVPAWDLSEMWNGNIPWYGGGTYPGVEFWGQGNGAFSLKPFGSTRIPRRDEEGGNPRDAGLRVVRGLPENVPYTTLTEVDRDSARVPLPVLVVREGSHEL